MGSGEEKTVESRLDELIERGKRIADEFKGEADKIRAFIEGKTVLEGAMSSLLEGFDGIGEAVNELCEKLGGSRENIGKPLDLLENRVFEQCLVVLSRAMGLWYRRVAIAYIGDEEKVREWRHSLKKNLTLLGWWVGACIRWSREANPPIRPLHDLLMEVKATFADNLVEALEFEERQRRKE